MKVPVKVTVTMFYNAEPEYYDNPTPEGIVKDLEKTIGIEMPIDEFAEICSDVTVKAEVIK